VEAIYRARSFRGDATVLADYALTMTTISGLLPDLPGHVTSSLKIITNNNNTNNTKNNDNRANIYDKYY